MARVTPLRAGDYVFVQYNADPEYYHERLLLAPVPRRPLHWIVATPDADVYLLDLNTPPLDVMRPCPPGGSRRLPVGFDPNDCYRFEHGEMGVPTRAQRAQLLEEGARLAIAHGAPGFVAAPDAGDGELDDAEEEAEDDDVERPEAPMPPAGRGGPLEPPGLWPPPAAGRAPALPAPPWSRGGR